MSEPLWTYETLAWHARAEDPEVRCWAAERLVRCFPEQAPSAVALLLLDEHESTPELVAENLRDHGSAEHIPLLMRAWKQMRGIVPGRAFQALARLAPGEALDLAAGCLDRRGLSEASLTLVVEATAAIDSDRARSVVREIVSRKVEILSEPSALRAALEAWPSEDLPELFSLFARALQWRGLGRCADLFRAVTDHIEADDCGWCLRTGPEGRVDVKKTIKAVESGYDCEVIGASPAITPDALRELLPAFRSADLASAIRSMAETLRVNAAAVRSTPARPADPDDPLPLRIIAVASALASPQFLGEASRLGPVFEQGIATVLLSGLFKVARYRNYSREVQRASGDLEALLTLAGEETAFLLEVLPAALGRLAPLPGSEAASEVRPRELVRRRERILEWCRRMLEAHGPFFPKAIALETIGELGAEDHVPELLDSLSDENSYVYAAAEKALANLGPAIVGPVRVRLEAGALDHEALHGLLILLVEMGDRAALQLILDHFDDLVEQVGVEETAEWAGLLGARELYEPLHRLLPRDLARVGQSLLLIGAIHNIPVAEEVQIQQAIEDYWRRHPDQGEGGGDGDEDGGSGKYLM